ncbi:hypothetical protein J2T58_001486 [Methanocalculus alkaliphilus]|nr:hypothetical protein [Methanocalculus alkaliphilus]
MRVTYYSNIKKKILYKLSTINNLSFFAFYTKIILPSILKLFYLLY